MDAWPETQMCLELSLVKIISIRRRWNVKDLMTSPSYESREECGSIQQMPRAQVVEFRDSVFSMFTQRSQPLAPSVDISNVFTCKTT